MMVTLAVPDEVYAKYVGHFPQNPKKALIDQLTRYQDSSPKDRVLVFNQPQRAAIEALFGLPIEDMEKVVEWITRLKTFNIGEASFTLKEGQLKQLTTQAAAYKKTVPEYIKERVKTAIGNELGNY